MRSTTGNSFLARDKTRGRADMYLQHFGLRHPPLGKNLTEPWDDGPLVKLAERFNWLLLSPGIGLLTGEPGVGKTAALRSSLTHSLNPHRYQMLYQAETDFGRVDIYRGLDPQLSVEAVIQIHDFVHYALDLFEVHYGTQIDGFYETLFEQSQDIELDLGDSSF